MKEFCKQEAETHLRIVQAFIRWQWIAPMMQSAIDLHYELAAKNMVDWYLS
jgi:hypothetical protein